MWESIKGFFRRHKRKFVVGGIVITGIYIVSRYARWRLDEWRANQELEYIAQARKQHHFESNQRTCSVTLYSLIPSLRDSLLDKLNTEEITAKLREKPANKLELWESLKTLSFARTVTAVYSSCMLFVFLRVQLNVIGGYMYLDSLVTPVEGGSNGKRKHVAEGMQKKYLALVKYLLSEGLDKMTDTIKRSTEDILSDISLKDKLTHAELQRLINHIRQTFEFSQQTSSSMRSSQTGSTPLSSTRPFCQFMVPEDMAALDGRGETAVGGVEGEEFMRLVEETLDVLESEDCSAVLQGCLDVAFAHILGNIAPFFQAEELGMSFKYLLAVSLPLAKIIPIVNGQIYHMFSDSDNSYLQDLFKVRFAGEFAANVYEAFSTEVD
ncbi:predicted protein [Nematostella vectensis]|uniref:Peroxisomal biogenesis factor 3 n=1 Tax=Nematostella vectensis TaxID=45351 RepID=A7RZD3_NEMVE|nr:predicted protein [Nematostella vectensis]|eukprot:XP_001635320.1 predicted protein [Nematostella vectensis]